MDEQDSFFFFPFFFNFCEGERPLWSLRLALKRRKQNL